MNRNLKGKDDSRTRRTASRVERVNFEDSGSSRGIVPETHYPGHGILPAYP